MTIRSCRSVDTSCSVKLGRTGVRGVRFQVRPSPSTHPKNPADDVDDERTDQSELEERRLVHTSRRGLEAVVEVRAEDGEGGVGEVDEDEEGKQESRNGLHSGESYVIHRAVNNRAVNKCQPLSSESLQPGLRGGAPVLLRALPSPENLVFRGHGACDEQVPTLDCKSALWR